MMWHLVLIALFNQLVEILSTHLQPKNPIFWDDDLMKGV
jgi:hypothetical protein